MSGEKSGLAAMPPWGFSFPGSASSASGHTPGGNAFASPDDLGRIPGRVVSRITLVHLTDSALGAVSWPLGRSRGRLTALGREFVAACNQHRILVDLAQISRSGFADVLEAHDPALPPVVSHTGMSAVRPSWRNIDDDQIRAVAARGGTEGQLAGPESRIPDLSDFLMLLASPT